MTVELKREDSRVTWILGPAFIVAFLLAFSVGANDVSNSFGTSVGSGVLTVTQACMLATFFEVAGSTLLGHSVCDFFRQKMYRVELYQDEPQDLMIGALGCLVGSALWNIIATKLKMPISGTHSVIGATIGFNLVLRGMNSIQWMQTVKIVGSWFVSPLLSGLISSIIYVTVSKSIIAKYDPLKSGLKALPLFYGATIFINVASLFIDGPRVFGLNTLPWYLGLLISLIICGAVIVWVAVVTVPRTRRRILLELDHLREQREILQALEVKESAKNDNGSHDNPAFANDVPESKSGNATSTKPAPIHQLQRQLARDSLTEEVIKMNELNTIEKTLGQELDTKISHKPSDYPRFIDGERIEVHRLFSSLQVMTACFASFAHGTNDVSNAVAPLVPIWNIWSFGEEKLEVSTQAWLLFFGGVGICSGLWAWGRAVIRTVGKGLTRLTPSKGFSIELGAAISVLFASKIGIPISTTHCKVGSLVILGLVSDRFCSKDFLFGLTKGHKASSFTLDELLAGQAELDSNKVDWKLFGNIAITWIVTVPLAAIAAALTTLLLRSIAPDLESSSDVSSVSTALPNT